MLKGVTSVTIYREMRIGGLSETPPSNGRYQGVQVEDVIEYKDYWNKIH
jgi:hypothetical protein